LILKISARAARAPMPATVAAFQINTAQAAEASEEDFSAVIRLAENLARVNTHQNGRDNLQSSKLQIRNSKQIQMTKHKENSKRASLDSVFWILFPGAFGGKMFTWLIDTNGDWVFTMVG
jgi:hypothetical protein